MKVSFKLIGRNVQNVRIAQNISQEEAAHRLGMSNLHYGRLERGERPASLEQLANIASVYDVPTLSLINGCIPSEPYYAVPTQASKTFADKIASMTSACSPEELELIIHLCHTIIKGNTEGESPLHNGTASPQ